jgi:hypothetical protein
MKSDNHSVLTWGEVLPFFDKEIKIIPGIFFINNYIYHLVITILKP